MKFDKRLLLVGPTGINSVRKVHVVMTTRINSNRKVLLVWDSRMKYDRKLLLVRLIGCLKDEFICLVNTIYQSEGPRAFP